MLRYLSDEGVLLDDLPLDNDELLRGYRAMRRARFVDDRLLVLQRQGRLGVYASFLGQEAAQIGTALALRPDDWLVPSYRESAAAIAHGLPLETLILYWRAHPAGWRFPDGLGILPFCIPIATQLPQAVGLAMAFRHRGEDGLAMAYIGDGGTSEGDFHEALNFAAVFAAPLVVVVQNNGWAISVPTERQMKNTRIVDRAVGYGIPGVEVDGNDLVAVWQATREAVARARAGEGPTLIEAKTYRLAPHTTSDDPGRYRSEDAGAAWLARDPIRRVRRLLETRELWDEAREEALTEELTAEFRAALQQADEAPEPEPWEIVEHVFADMGDDQRMAWEALHDDA